MQNRTFIRIMLDIFLNNAIVKTIASFMDFLREQSYYNNSKELNFFNNAPLNKTTKNDYSFGQIILKSNR